MLDESGRRGLSRRDWLLFAGAGFASLSRGYGYYGGKEFWDAKDPDSWNSDEIARLLTKSPWAKGTSAESVKKQKDTMSSSTNPTMPGSRPPRNRMPGGNGNKKDPASKVVTTYKGTVVWESAAPVRAALRTRLPENFDGQYVLGVTGVLLTKSDSRSAIEKVRQNTTLQAKGKPPVEAQTAAEDTTNGTLYLFGFSRESLTLSKDDKDIVFTTHMGKLAFTVKFNPKDMLYHGELAV